MSLSKLKFKHVNILKDEVLGTGAYGTVYRAKCDDLLCAAKCLHQAILYQSGLQAEYSGSPVSRFEREINLLSSFHHPNIVQYLGVYEDSGDAKQPVLLMELMDQSLTKYLAESKSQRIPYHLQVDICQDIALALSFLHHNDIFHRDMSSNNVLMLGDRAKITDFGMANTTQAIGNQMTKCPGTDVYMPPEAVIGNPKYTSAKIDCFSFGVLVLQILTKVFPNPGERQKLADDNEENFLSTYVRVPEVERRKNHIDLVNPKHPLLPLSLDCLNDIGMKRPTAQQLCERIAILKESSEYVKSKEVTPAVPAEQNGDTEEGVSRISSRELENFIFQGQELENLRGLLDDERKKHSSEISEANSHIYELEKTNAEQEHEIDHLKKCLGGAVSEKESLQEKVEALQLNTNAPDKPPLLRSLRTNSVGSALNWTEGSKSPPECQISKGYAVVRGDIVYVSSFSNNKIGAYNSSDESWSILAECPTCEFAMVDIEGNLTIIGGCSTQESYSNCLYTYYEDDADKQSWNDDYPPMPTKRKAVAAICTQSVLIVAGGEAEGESVLAKVEIMDINLRVWNSTVSIPSGRKNASLVTCGHCLYLIGGKNSYNKECATIYACSLGVLLPMRQPDTLFKHVAGTIDPLRYWAKIANLPLVQTASISVGGQLYAIGGRNSESGQIVRSVYVYDLCLNTWQNLTKGRMVTSRYNCVAAVFRNNQVIVFGGQSDGESLISTIEIASFDFTSSTY